MELTAEFYSVALLAAALGVVAAGARLARADLHFKVWHGVLGWVGSSLLLMAATSGVIPDRVFLPLLGLAVLLCIGSTVVFYAARRRSKGEAAAVSLAPAMRDQPSEPILGWFEARQMNIWTSDIEYAFLVAPHRLVAVRIGGQFSGAPLPQHELGAFGAFFQREVAAFQAQRRSALERVFASADVDTLLRSHRANFQLEFEGVKAARIEARPWYAQFSWQGPATLTLEPASGPSVSFLLQTPEQVQRCVALLQRLRPRVDPELLTPRVVPRG
jgi:hypothetical protein